MSGQGSIDSRLLRLFDEAMDQPSDTRRSWIEARTVGDDELRRRAMAALNREAGSGVSIRTGAGLHADDRQTVPPERIGAYRLTGLIGQGGMGSVYRGERAAGDFDHVVAIKLIRLGALSQALIERFRSERQTLARLAHPHIARLLDGGETDTGQPYFIMEHVDGRPLDKWLADDAPTLDQRLQLFLDLCSAVSFAHRNLVIHRDITPSNVLVEGDGVAKLIDFGIAKPPAPTSAEPMSQHSLAGVSLTPGYAAPERVAGAPATTLSDVYSLGILLGRIASNDADVDLRAIVARASAVDPEERYPTADAIADDVRNLRAGRPVAARGGGRRYAVGKFVRRHRTAVALAAAALLLLLAALAVALVSYARAERARAEEERRFEEVRALASYLLFDFDDRLVRVPGNTAARAALSVRAQTYLDRLSGVRADDPDLTLETARGRIRLAEIQGVPTFRNLNEADAADANLARAEASLVALAAAGVPAAEFAPALATARAHRSGIALQARQEGQVATRHLAAAIDALATVPAAGRTRDWYDARRRVRLTQLEHFDLNGEPERLTPTADLLEREIGERRATPAAAVMDRAIADYYRGIVAIGGGEATAATAAARFDAALRGFQSIEARDRNNPELLYWITWSAAMAFEAYSDADGAPAAARIETAYDAVGRLSAVADRDDSVFVLTRMVEEGRAQHLANIGSFPEAIAAHRSVIAREEARVAREGGQGTDLAWSRSLLGITARKANDRALACENWRLAERTFAAAQARGRLSEFYGGLLPGLRRNLALCDTGRPAAEMGPLR